MSQFDKFKKMGANFLEDAKSGKLTDKLKSTVDTIAGSKNEDDPSITGITDPIEAKITKCQKIFEDLQDSNKIQANLIGTLKAEIQALATELKNQNESAEDKAPDTDTTTDDKPDT